MMVLLMNIFTYELVGGHSPYHHAFWIKENGETIFFGGDVAPQLAANEKQAVLQNTITTEKKAWN